MMLAGLFQDKLQLNQQEFLFAKSKRDTSMGDRGFVVQEKHGQ